MVELFSPIYTKPKGKHYNYASIAHLHKWMKDFSGRTSRRNYFGVIRLHLGGSATGTGGAGS
jgi:hypothetical protein